MSIFIKICGITNDEDANLSIECGADAIGLNQYEKSPRFVNKKELLKDKIVICSEQTHGLKCIDCKLCNKSDRKVIIGFLEH